jgi:hypothetical protein
MNRLDESMLGSAAPLSASAPVKKADAHAGLPANMDQRASARSDQRLARIPPSLLLSL